MHSFFEEEDEDDVEEEENEYEALCNENMELKSKTQEMLIEEDKVAEDYDIEQILFQTLEACLKFLEEDHMKTTCEADVQMQNLK